MVVGNKLVRGRSVDDSLASWELKLGYELRCRPGFISVQNTGINDRNIVHLRHKSGIDINIASIYDMLGGFGMITLAGTKAGIQIRANDTYYAFKKQLVSYVHFLKTGQHPVPWKETYELMQLVIGGIKSREENGSIIEIKQEI